MNLGKWGGGPSVEREAERFFDASGRLTSFTGEWRGSWRLSSWQDSRVHLEAVSSSGTVVAVDRPGALSLLCSRSMVAKVVW